MRTHATAQLIGDRSHQCDATATYTHHGVRAYTLLDGIGSSDDISDWTRTAARRLARAAARHGDAEAGLRAVYAQYATEPDRQDPFNRPPTACAVVAVTAPRKPLTIAWCGDTRAYILTTSGTLHRLTTDHNMRRVVPAWGSRNRITSWLGSELNDEQVKNEVGHPAIETATRYADGERLLLASDGAYEPLEDNGSHLSDHLIGTPAEAARGFTKAAIAHAGEYADNATVLVADLLDT
jgi:PPM family protein phosphatase